MGSRGARRRFWLMMLGIVLLNGVVVTVLGCYFLTSVAFYFWPVLLVAQLVLSLPHSGQEWSSTRRAVAIGGGVCFLLSPLWVALCEWVSNAPG
jgi:hypothetical protein